MTDYSKLSDFEINKMICDVFWHDLRKSAECKNKSFPQNTSVVYMHNGYGGFSRDYCNTPSDAWSIITKNKIDINWGDDVHHALKGAVIASRGKLSATHSNPLRAAMIVFLQMQEDKQ